jgi:prevent-host-death family protein
MAEFDKMYNIYFCTYMPTTLSVAEARRRLAEVLGKVYYASEEFIIARKGKPVARIVPYVALATDHPRTLGDVKGWLDPKDNFFQALASIRRGSSKPRNPFVKTGR